MYFLGTLKTNNDNEIVNFNEVITSSPEVVISEPEASFRMYLGSLAPDSQLPQYYLIRPKTFSGKYFF